MARKKVAADFDAGRLTYDGGVMLMAMAEGRLGIGDRLARSFPDRGDPLRIAYTLADMIRARAFACIILKLASKPYGLSDWGQKRADAQAEFWLA